MARILAISSQVVRGHVGLSAIVPALQHLGHEVLAIPTVLLSNHPGHVRAAGTRIEVNTLMSMLDVLEANGWLADIDAVLTGYMPTAAHVGFAVRAIERVHAHAPRAMIVVDPVAGDDPRGMYIADDAADALRNDLIPLANVITPNRFELSWLSRVMVANARDAIRAARAIGRATLLATSVPTEDGKLVNLCITPDRAVACRVSRWPSVPQGTGDLLSGLFTGHALNGLDHPEALGRAVAGVQRAIAASRNATDLVLTGHGADLDWSAAPPLLAEDLSE